MALIPDIQIAFELNGERRELNFREVKFSTWQMLKQKLGFTPQTLIQAIGETDVEAIAALIWLEHRNTRPNLSIQSVFAELEAGADFEIVDHHIPGEDEVKEPEAEPDPSTAGSS